MWWQEHLKEAVERYFYCSKTVFLEKKSVLKIKKGIHSSANINMDKNWYYYTNNNNYNIMWNYYNYITRVGWGIVWHHTLLIKLYLCRATDCYSLLYCFHCYLSLFSGLLNVWRFSFLGSHFLPLLHSSSWQCALQESKNIRQALRSLLHLLLLILKEKKWTIIHTNYREALSCHFMQVDYCSGLLIKCVYGTYTKYISQHYMAIEILRSCKVHT